MCEDYTCLCKSVKLMVSSLIRVRLLPLQFLGKTDAFTITNLLKRGVF